MFTLGPMAWSIYPVSRRDGQWVLLVYRLNVLDTYQKVLDIPQDICILSPLHSPHEFSWLDFSFKPREPGGTSSSYCHKACLPQLLLIHSPPKCKPWMAHLMWNALLSRTVNICGSFIHCCQPHLCRVGCCVFGSLLIFKVGWIEDDLNSMAFSLMILPVLLSCKGQEVHFSGSLHTSILLLILAICYDSHCFYSHIPHLKKKKKNLPYFSFLFLPYSRCFYFCLHLSLSLRSAINFLMSPGFHKKNKRLFVVVLFGMVSGLVVGLVFCLGACGIIVPRPGIEPRPRAMKGRSLNHSITREFHKFFFFF